MTADTPTPDTTVVEATINNHTVVGHLVDVLTDGALLVEDAHGNERVVRPDHPRHEIVDRRGGPT